MKPARGFADVELKLALPANTDALDVRVIGANDPSKVIVPWATQRGTIEQLQEVQVRVPAGGWYQLQVRARAGESITESLDSSNFAVGDVFIVAGQSYATNTNEDKFAGARCLPPRGRL